jgi:hypothetical protein
MDKAQKPILFIQKPSSEPFRTYLTLLFSLCDGGSSGYVSWK